MLSQQAFNALLKTLEEPPSHVKFVFATTESHKVLPTIVSRCQRFEFRSIPAPLIVSKLEEICKVESIEVELEAIEAIARMAMGGMRDAQSILDQMISFCGKTISQADVLEVYGLASKERIQILAQYVIDGDYNSIIQYTDSFSTEGLDFYRALLDLSDTFRELLLDTLRSKGETVNCSAEQCVRILDSLRQGEDLVRMGLSEKTNFEVTLFRAVQSGRSRSIDHVIRKISGLIPEDVKKKPNLNQVNSASQSKVSTAETVQTVEELSKQSIVKKSTLVASGAGDLELNESAPPSVRDTPDGVVQKEEEVDNAIETEIPELNKEKPRQIVDREKIEEKIAELPNGIKNILKDKFQADFVSIEKIDVSKLI